MDFLISIPGPVFLLIFAVVAIGAIYIGRKMVHSGGFGGFVTHDYAQADVTTIAFLQGGDNEALRIAILSLLEKKCVEIKQDKLVSPDNGVEKEGMVIAGIPASGMSLSALERELHQHLLTRKMFTDDIFDDDKITGIIDRHATAVEQHLLETGMLASLDDYSRASRIRVAVIAIIVLFGGTKLWLGIIRHRPVAFLIILLILSIIAAIIAIRVKGRLSPKGEKYLAGLKQHYAKLKDPATAGGFDPVLASALFGIGVLGATQAYAWLYDPYQQSFKRGGSMSGCSSSGCSGSSGGSDGGGSGCGGGCGGCGGD